MCKVKSLLLGVVSLVVCFGFNSAGHADFVELEKVLADPAKALAEKVGDQTVIVATRDMAKVNPPWPMHIAIGVEFTAALRRRKVDAVRSGGDPRFDKLESPHVPFAAKDAKFAKDADRKVLVGLEWTASPNPTLKVVAFQTDQPKPIWKEVIDIPKAAVDLKRILPPRNVKVLEFAKQMFGKKVGNGEGATLAAEGLSAASSEKKEIYRWGRELGQREPWLPGNILQVENFQVTLPEGAGKREYKHQVVVIEDIQPTEVTILQQNAFPKGMIVQRETWPVSALTGGEIIAFRPWDWPEPNPYPPASPSRILPPKVVSTGKKINLLKTLDSRLDRVNGVWYLDKDGLRSHRELCCRIQVPIAPPKAYLLSMTAKRIAGADQLGLGIVLDGHQTLISMDCAGGSNTGLNLLDGKAAHENESTVTGALLPQGKKVEIQCRVEPGQITLSIDGKEVLEWKGDATRVSVPEDFAMPNKTWLFIASHETTFEISSFTLEPIAMSGTK